MASEDYSALCNLWAINSLRNHYMDTLYLRISLNRDNNSNQHQMHQPEGEPETERGVVISDNDVLIDGDDARGFKLIDDDHVGNKRFQVFLKLYREEYNRAKISNSQGDMARIVDTILDIVCRKCIRHGRFLERVSYESTEGESKSEWIDLGEGALARHCLHQALSQAVVEENTEAEPGEQQPPFPSQYHYQTTNAEFAGAAEPRTLLMRDLSCSLKRQRRGSYTRLRRSASESEILRSLQNPTLLCNEQREDFNIVPSLQTSSISHALTFLPMDVVFASSRKTLAPTGNPGNARLQIAVDMHASSFGKSDMTGKQRILDDLISNVQLHWEGRFLLQTFQDSFEELTTEATSECLRALLLREGEGGLARMNAPLSAPTPPCRMPSKRCLSDCNENPTLLRTAGAIGEDIDSALRIAMSPTPLLKDFNRSTKSLLPSTRPSTKPHASYHDTTPSILQLLRSPSVIAGSNEHLRNAAILSLKARQKKRELMERFFSTKKQA